MAPPDGKWLMVGADYASLEDRISALQTKDPEKLKVYLEGYDGHCLRAYAYFKNQMPDRNSLDVVVCTPTLAMGVNLPADYVLFSTAETFRRDEGEFRVILPQPMTPLEYRNFAGRAGRLRPKPRPDHHGVALFLTHFSREDAQRELVEGLIQHSVNPIEPALHRWPYG